MRFLAVHPGPLMYTRIFLRLEPLGPELVANAARQAGHDVRLIDLQVESHQDYFRMVRDFRPDAIGFSGNYLANVPEIIDLAKASREKNPETFIFVGGHSVSFIADEILRHAEGAIDCVLRGEGEAAIDALLTAAADGREAVAAVPGVVTENGPGPPPAFVTDLNDHRPARDLLRHRNRYYIGSLDPAASIEFTRGCPWDCTFCSAWTFYGRSYRMYDVDVAVEELSRVREPGIFIVDDVAFIQKKHGLAIGEGIARRGIKKEYYLETRADVLLKNKEVFEFWRDLGLKYMFLGLEAIDAEGLKKYRKRVSLGENFEALEYARKLGIVVAVNLIADPAWDRDRFRVVREWCLDIPEIVNISVNTPYPGTETWQSESRRLISRDYRLFDIQHTVLPTRLPLREFYEELVTTQQVLNKKHLGLNTMFKVSGRVLNRLLHGQTNFLRMLYRFNEVYDPELLLADHERAVVYELPSLPAPKDRIDAKELYVHPARGRKSRQIDDTTERFVDTTRMGTTI